jgi:hypothetical protein
VVGQGLSFAVIERAHPSTDPQQRQPFQRAHCIWLGDVEGAEWLHEAIQSRFGALVEPYSVASQRTQVFAGASSELGYVVLTLLGVPLVAALKKIGAVPARTSTAGSSGR